MTILAAYAVPHPPLILPEIGKGEEKLIQASIDAFKKVAEEIRDLRPDTIIIVSPHAFYDSDAFYVSSGSIGIGDFERFGHPEVKFSVPYDEELVAELIKVGKETPLPIITNKNQNDPLDHATMVPLYFIQQVYPETRIVRSGFSSLSQVRHYSYGRAITKAAARLGRMIVFIASGDLSHRLLKGGPNGYAPEGPEFDALLVKGMETGQLDAFFGINPDFWQAAGDCGLRAFQIMAGALHNKDIVPKLLSYEGPFGVGYAVASFHVKGENPNQSFIASVRDSTDLVIERRDGEDEYVSLARATLETYARKRRLVEIPAYCPKEALENRAGVFVTLKIRGNLRGCVGTVRPTRKHIADEIRHNTLVAAYEDHRFEPVRLEELPYIDYSVSILSEPEIIENIVDQDVRKYGIVVTSKGKSGVLLPGLDSVRTAEEQLRAALNKAGVHDGEQYKIERFEAVKHERQRV